MTSFTSATLGEIRPPLNIVREFLAIFKRRQKCKAAILSWLDVKHYYGNFWVRITFENLADDLGYCRETVSKHMKELIFDGLVEDKPSHRFPKDTASEYKLNLDKIRETIDYHRCEKNSVKASDNLLEPAKEPATTKTSLKTSKSNNAAEEKRDIEPVRDTITSKADTCEQTQTFRCSKQPGQMDLNESTGFNDDKSSLDDVEVVMASTFREQIDRNIFKSPKNCEIKVYCADLRRLRINPDSCMGVIKKYWGNVAGAIARVKEAIKEGWCDNPTGLFLASCKNGEKAKNAVTTEVSDWFEWARRERIVIAMSSGVVYTSDGEAVKIEEMMRRYPMQYA